MLHTDVKELVARFAPMSRIVRDESQPPRKRFSLVVEKALFTASQSSGLVLPHFCGDRERQEKRLVARVDVLLTTLFPVCTQGTGKVQLLGSQVTKQFIAHSPRNRVKTNIKERSLPS